MSALDHIPLYDYETAIEAAVQTILVAADIPTYASFSPAELDPPRPRPRVEIELQTGAATGHRSTSTEVYRPDSFTGTLSLTVITNTSDEISSTEEPINAGARAHAQFRALVRYHCGGIETTLTDDANAGDTMLPYHSVNRFIEAGTSPTINTENGLLASQLNWEIHFNIRPEAWPV
jgi:hypothetical protein